VIQSARIALFVKIHIEIRVNGGVQRFVLCHHSASLNLELTDQSIRVRPTISQTALHMRDDRDAQLFGDLGGRPAKAL
jgi:hypothetical protein